MASLGIQFHAAPDEILDFVDECSVKDNTFTTYLWDHQGIHASWIQSAEDRRQALATNGVPRFVRLTVEPPVLETEGEVDFTKKNPGCLLVEIGAASPDELRESFLGVKTVDLRAMVTWRRIASRFRKRTKAG